MLLVLGAVDELELDDDDEEDVLVAELFGDFDEDSCIRGAERCISPVEELEPDEDDDEDSCILGAERCIAPVEELEPDEDGEFVKESNDEEDVLVAELFGAVDELELDTMMTTRKMCSLKSCLAQLMSLMEMTRRMCSLKSCLQSL